MGLETDSRECGKASSGSIYRPPFMPDPGLRPAAPQRTTRPHPEYRRRPGHPASPGPLRLSSNQSLLIVEMTRMFAPGARPGYHRQRLCAPGIMLPLADRERKRRPASLCRASMCRWSGQAARRSPLQNALHPDKKRLHHRRVPAGGWRSISLIKAFHKPGSLPP